jgi:ABC-type sulfate/molybdate transport systems ATPase subunit
MGDKDVARSKHSTRRVSVNTARAIVTAGLDLLPENIERHSTTEGVSEDIGHVSMSQLPAAVMLETKNLSRAVDGNVLVDDVSIQLHPGEIVAVVGPSGAGKSSLLRLINRLDEPTGGTVLLNGKDYRAIPPHELRRRIGMVMQTAYLFPGTVAANIAFGPLQRGDMIMKREIAELLKRVGLHGYQDRNVVSLSGGEAQRVSVARTLANAPEALLLDEPTSALDEASARGIEELVLDIIKERRMTCLLVTHNKAQAARIAVRTIVMAAGCLRAIGPSKEVLGDC